MYDPPVHRELGHRLKRVVPNSPAPRSLKSAGKDPQWRCRTLLSRDAVQGGPANSGEEMPPPSAVLLRLPAIPVHLPVVLGAPETEYQYGLGQHSLLHAP